MVKNLYLVEKYQVGMTFPDGTVVALTPQACYQLDQQKIPYQIPEDYYDWVEQNKQDWPYLNDQLAWLDKIDDELLKVSAALKEINFRPLRLYRFYLKHSVDVIVLNAKMLGSILDDVKPQKIVYLYEEKETTPLDWQLRHRDENILIKLLPLVSAARNISYVAQALPQSWGGNDGNKINVSGLKVTVIKLISILRKVYVILKNSWLTLSGRPKAKKAAGLQKTFFLLKKNWGLTSFAVDADQRGHKVYWLENDEIYRFNKFYGKQRVGKWKIGLLPVSEKVQAEWEAIFTKLNTGNLVCSWINQQSGLDVSSIFRPTLKYFIENICPVLIKYAKQFRNIYSELNVDYVLTPHRWELFEFAALEVAKQRPATTAVMVTHGYSVVDSSVDKLTEMCVDHYVATDQELAQYLNEKISGEIDSPKKISSAKLWFDSRLKAVNAYRQQQGEAPTRTKPRIVYVPTFFNGIQRRRLDACHYPDCWYYKLHQALLSYLASLKDYDFIYKAKSGGELLRNPVKAYLQNEKIQNVTFSQNSLLEEYKYADKVITDYPSTPLIEALAMGIPTLVIPHVGIHIRESAKKKFGKILQSFETFEQLKTGIATFLNAKDSEYLIQVRDEALPELIDVLNN